jgi:NodT family efflux transporter outer membrane factor (OMF) lipoprotein
MISCAVGPDFVKPEVSVAQNWTTSTDPRVSSQASSDSLWWKTFSDPVLDRLIGAAWQQNLPLQIAGLRIVEARAQLGVATGMRYPQVQALTGSAMAVGLPQTVFNAPIADRNFGAFQLGFDASWELDLWGKFKRGVEAETAGLLGSVADYESALVTLTAEVARTYVAFRTFEVLIDQAQENAKLQEEGLAIATSRFKNGATSELDPTQAKTLLESTRATIPPLQASLQQSRNALSTLLGLQPGGVDALLTGPRIIPQAPLKVAVGVPAEMLRRRPDIRSAEFLAAAQCARIGIAKAELYPSFSLFGTVGLEATSGAASTHSLFSTSSLFYVVGPRINWPFLNYGRLENGVRVQDARFQQALVNYRDTVLRAAQEVEDGLSGFLNAQEASTFQQAAATSAAHSVELALVQYREGAADFQRVLDAERSLLQQQNGVAQSSSSVATNLIALYKALGGGWEVRQSQPAVPQPTQRQMEERTNWGDLLSQPRAPESAQNKPPAEH